MTWYGAQNFGRASTKGYELIIGSTLFQEGGVPYAQSNLKGLCHENFALLGQFCAKLITHCLKTCTECSCETVRKISNEFC